MKSFYSGVMQVGKYKGEKIMNCKQRIKEELIVGNRALQYYEPEQEVISRNNQICVVKLVDQWFINYGQENLKQQLKEYVQEELKTYNASTKSLFLETLDWLNEWGCSRTFGIGTSLPFDQKYIIESLSDSTIYMSYYTICHYLHSDLYGKEGGLLGIRAEEADDDFYDYIFGLSDQNKSKVQTEKMDVMRGEFQHFYPFDLRCSGRDLIKNHLTFSLYNHLVVFGKEYLPKGFFCNGFVMVDNEKMSKQLGNFLTLGEVIGQYGSDAVRLVLSQCGDSIDDANYNSKEQDNAVLKLFTLKSWVEEHIDKF